MYNGSNIKTYSSMITTFDIFPVIFQIIS